MLIFNGLASWSNSKFGPFFVNVTMPLAEYETQVREKILQEQQLAANQPTSTTGKDMEDEDR